MTEVVREGKPVQRPDRSGFWPLHARATFGMALLRGAAAARLLSIQSGQGLKILDAPCGSGGLGFALVQADPTATVVGVDSLDVVAVAREYAHQLGLEERVSLSAVDIVTSGTLGDNCFDVAVMSGFLNSMGQMRHPAFIPRPQASEPVRRTTVPWPDRPFRSSRVRTGPPAQHSGR